MKLKKNLLVGLLVTMITLPLAAEAGSLGKAVFRGATKSTSKTLRGSTARTLRRDLLRDRVTRARPLFQKRRVFRYTTKTQARQELQRGIGPGSHMTARAAAGRPLSPVQARRRYGLPQRPEVRETVRLPKGQPIRPNRVVGGAAGVGELTSSRRVPPEAIEKVVPLR
jgi:hypothetical protein